MKYVDPVSSDGSGKRLYTEDTVRRFVMIFYKINNNNAEKQWNFCKNSSIVSVVGRKEAVFDNLNMI